MELNKIIRRSGFTSTVIYEKFVSDLADALKDFYHQRCGTHKILSRYKQEKLYQGCR